jgi:hypothetical protein
MFAQLLQLVRDAGNQCNHSEVGLGSVLLLCMLIACPAGAADPRESAPRTLIITYHVAPANRLAFRREMEQSAGRQFQRWKDDGVLQSYRVLINRYVDSANWDAMALLSFDKEADIERWKSVELEAPAGISQKALALATAIETVPADLMRQNGTAQSVGGSVFLIIPYDYVVSLDDYIAYLDGYVLPQSDGWMEEGVLASYGIYLARYPAGRPWQSLLVLEYKSDHALGARDAAVAKVRARLKENPKWKAISDSKKNVRVEKAPVIADPIAAQ